MKQALVDEFVELRPALEAWRGRAEAELRALLPGVDVQLLGSRTKSVESLRGKLARPDRTYVRLFDITDLVGLRVVTSFEDSVDEAARLIERHWRVDFVHSADKRGFKDHERFGYRSLHYVCAAPDDAGLPGGFRFEVQLRTVLQHAWAEVEHDLGYKASAQVPEVIRRRFARIASLLELADQEFSSIRSDLRRYQQRVHDDLSRPGLAVDVVSLGELVDTDDVRALDEAVAGVLGCRCGDAVFFPDYLVAMLGHAGLSTTAAVQAAVVEHGAAARSIVDAYRAFARAMWQLDLSALPAVERGYGLFFVAHVALLRRDELHLSRVARVAQTYRALDYPDDEREAHRVASALAAALLPVLDPR